MHLYRDVSMHQVKSYIRHFFIAKRKGHNVHSPFVYRLCEDVFYNEARHYDFEELRKIRLNLINSKQEIEVEDFGAGSKTFTGNKRKVSDLVHKGISTQKQSELFYRLINYLKPSCIIELGTSLGVNTIYLAKANTHSKVYSIEGSKALSDFAKHLAEKNKADNISFICEKFDHALPALLKRLGQAELVYVDGNHTYEATLHYFNLLLDYTTENTVLIFDDIYWSEGMTRAWEEITNHPKVTLTIDTFYFGVVFFRTEMKEKVNLKIML